MIRILTLFAIGVSLFADSSDANGWRRVTAIPSGTKVEVIHGALKSVTGEMVSANDAEITIRSGSGTASIARVDVLRVTTHSHSRKKRALIGMAIGAGAGALAAVAGGNKGDIDVRRSYIGGGGALLGAGAGAAIGAISGGPLTLYRATPGGARP